jgi:electron transfer flavoprotein alpha subunit
MAENRATVWVIAEQGEDGLQSVSLQLIGKARQLAVESGALVGTVLLGHQLEKASQGLIAAGADLVCLGDSPSLALYQPELYSNMIVDLMTAHQPEILLIGSTFMGRELAPLVAARLETGLTAHCIDLKLNDDGILEQIIPAYGGMITIICPEKRPQMATAANGVFSNPELDPHRVGEIIPIAVPDDSSLRIRTLEIVREYTSGVALESAAVVVAGGAGLGDRVGWKLAEELAGMLNAACGSTRPVVDEGWAKLETMIGQSGKMVSPELYIALGLSGELQHMVGIVDAKIMISVNADPKAPIFELVDYGIVEDCTTFVPILMEKLNKMV